MNQNTALYQLGGRSHGPLPTSPTRDQVCAIDCAFQGLMVDGQIVWEHDAMMSEDSAFRLEIYAAKRALGDTHVNLGLDMTGMACLLKILDRMREAIAEGFYVLLMLKGDGTPGSPGHDDPGSLGVFWLMEHFATIVQQVTAAGLKPFTVFCPGFDGVVPAWQPFTRVNTFARMARGVLGVDGHLALELSAGYWCWSGEEDDWATDDGKCFDVILQEFPIDMGPPDDPPPANFTSQSDDVRSRWDQVWQVSKRLLGPRWNRPVDMPADDDPGVYNGGPCVHVTPRGKYFVNAFEYDTYERVRLNRLTDADVERHRNYFRQLGYEYVC